MGDREQLLAQLNNIIKAYDDIKKLPEGNEYDNLSEAVYLARIVVQNLKD